MVGHLGRGNIGDAWMVAGLREVLKTRAESVCFWGEPDRPSWASAGFLRTLMASDQLWLGPGSLFHDLAKRFRFRWSGLIKAVVLAGIGRLLGKRVSLVGVGVGPLKGLFARLLWRLLCGCCQFASVRDDASLAFFPKQFGVKRTGDPAFWAPLPNRPTGPILWDLGLILAPVGGILNGQPEWDTRILDGLVNALLATPKTDGVTLRISCFVASQKAEEADGPMAETCIQRLLEHGFTAQVSSSHHSPDDFLGWVSQCSALISVRYHGILAAAMLRKPCLALGYHPKCQRLWTELNADPAYYLDYFSVDSNRLAATLHTFLAHAPLLPRYAPPEACLQNLLPEAL